MELQSGVRIATQCVLNVCFQSTNISYMHAKGVDLVRFITFSLNVLHSVFECISCGHAKFQFYLKCLNLMSWCLSTSFNTFEAGMISA